MHVRQIYGCGFMHRLSLSILSILAVHDVHVRCAASLEVDCIGAYSSATQRSCKRSGSARAHAEVDKRFTCTALEA